MSALEGELAELLERSVEEGGVGESLSSLSVLEELAHVCRPLTSPRTETNGC